MLDVLSLSIESGLQWTARLTALSVLIQATEMLRMREETWGAQGVWRWGNLSQELGSLGPLLSEAPFAALLGLQWLCALILLLSPSLPLWPLVAGVTLLIAWRFRGTFNGGSDGMTFLTLVALSLAAFSGFGSWLSALSLGFIAIQSAMTYAIAGWVKARHASWWSGKALTSYLLRSNYRVPLPIQALTRYRSLVRAAAWVTVIFELLFPIVLFQPRFAPVFLGIGAVFHSLNFIFFGLNRFFWAWVATYPAILALSGKFSVLR